MTITPAFRISIGLVALTISLLLLGQLIGFAPDRAKAVLESRKNLAEALAVQFSTAASMGNFPVIKETLQTMVERNNDILSAAVRNSKGKLLEEAGEHLAHWQLPSDGRSTPTHVRIPIFSGQNQWGTVEIRFTPLWTNNKITDFKNSYLSLILFIGCTGFAGYFLLMKRSLRELDPSAVIPARVQAAFNVLKEGVLILDEKEQIVMANASFAKNVGKPASKLIGFKGSELAWTGYISHQDREQLPWMQVLQGEENMLGSRLTMERENNSATVNFVVNALPVIDGKGKRRGVLVTFDDVTKLEEMNLQLKETVNKLQLTTEEVQTKNLELEFLAAHDPMTRLLNRRALHEEFGQIFTEAQQHGSRLSCIMCDIDLFKMVNDRHGHAVGDKVIKMVAGLLHKNSRETDLVGRYGGEEFCIVLPNLDIKAVASIANRIRLAIQEDSSSGVQITMSFGIATLQPELHNPEELINQADKALYIAKESGRNRVICWGDKAAAPSQGVQENAA